MRFLTLAFDLFNSRQSFYILCPLWDTDADSLQGFPRYTSLHHPLANVSKSRGKYVIQRGLFSTEINISGDRHPRLVYRECNADGVGRNPARSAYPAHLSRQRSIPDRRAGRLEAEAPLGKLGLTGPCAAAAGRPSA